MKYDTFLISFCLRSFYQKNEKTFAPRDLADRVSASNEMKNFDNKNDIKNDNKSDI